MTSNEEGSYNHGSGGGGEYQLASYEKREGRPATSDFQDATMTTTKLKDGDEQNVAFPSFFTLLMESDGAVIPNTGSTARDHLANERTYLAWFRTALAVIGSALGLLKWDEFPDATAYFVLVLGVVMLVCSTNRYLGVMKLLADGKFEPNVREVFVVMIFTVSALLVGLVMHFMGLI